VGSLQSGTGSGKGGVNRMKIRGGRLDDERYRWEGWLRTLYRGRVVLRKNGGGIGNSKGGVTKERL